MRRFLKFSVIFVIAAIFMATITGCGNNKDDSSIDDLYSAVSQYEEIIDSMQSEKENDPNNKQKFVVVIPSGCGADLLYGAEFLSREMSKYVAYEVEVAYDSDLKKSNENIEILVGATDRQESIEYLKELRTEDFGYAYSNGSVVIGAHSDELCVEAINNFVLKIVGGTIKLSYIHVIDPYVERAEYAADEVKLCGFPITEYDIVYPDKNLMGEKALANILRDMIAKSCGYSLRVISDKQATEATRAICVGQSSLTSSDPFEGTATISVNSDGHIELISDKNAGIYRAAEEFINIVGQSENDGKYDVVLSGSKSYSYNGDPISFYVVRDDFSNGSIDAYMNAVQGIRNSSLAVFDSLSETVRTNLHNNLGRLESADENSFYHYETGNFSCILVESKLLDGGAELLTLVMERTDGKHFVFIGGFAGEVEDDQNLLLALEAECRKYSDLPIVVAHELSESLDRSFDDNNVRFCAVDGAKGLYFSADRLAVGSALTSEITDELLADVLLLDFYYS